MTGTDRIARGVVGDGAARVVAVVATELAREATGRHAAGIDAALAMGRAATAGLLLATLTKDDERVTLQILGDGPLGALTVDASGAGTARVYVNRPRGRSDRPGRSPSGAPGDGGDQRPSVGDAVGRHGLVSVVRDLGLGQNFSGQTSIVDGEIDTDVEHYLSTSEQVDSALGCETRLDATGRIWIAVGVLVQALPGSDGAALVAEARLRLRDGALGAWLADLAGATPATAGETTTATAATAATAADPASVIRAALGDDFATFRLLDERPVRFHCPCSAARAASTLALLGEAELLAMIRDDGRADVTCEFCRARYDFSDADLDEIRRGLHPADRPS